MARIHFLLTLVFVALAAGASAAENPNIIPLPKSVVNKEGSYKLKRGFSIGATGLPEDMSQEITKFINTINLTADMQAAETVGKGDITIIQDSNLPKEGYDLNITPSGIMLKASTATGLFYGFQTLKKLLPPNIAAGVSTITSSEFELPCMAILDEPRFGYRGFMLDVSRHFFDVNEIRKMLDLMALYKLNRFHWHLTDDHGWRLPMDKYPRLTQEGATNRNILLSDFDAQIQTRPGKDTKYGPYSYTKEEIKEIVKYAAERHIEVIPEIDMPGHMVAAIHAYPEFSTDPESMRAKTAGIDLDSDPVGKDTESHFTHNIWNVGGISKDVLDISNPKVMEFAKDVIDVVAELFPYEYIHIGGDECPTDAWQKSASCQKLKKQLRLKNDHALQTWFTKEIAEYAMKKHNRKIMGWNEILTSEGADVKMVKKIDPVIFCWYPPQKSVEACERAGIKHIFTPFNGGYYINRAYKGFDKIGAVGDGSLRTAYTCIPPENNNCIGVQGTFWTEQVDRNRDLEYLALPRLLAISEQGWTPGNRKDYEDFIRRVKADTATLQLGGYNYGRHQLEEPQSNSK